MHKCLGFPQTTPNKESNIAQFAPRWKSLFFCVCVLLGLFGGVMALAQEGDAPADTVIYGVTMTQADTLLDLSGRTQVDVQALCEALASAPQIRTVDLHGAGLSLAQMQALRAACPSVNFLWSTSFRGQNIDSAQTTLDFGEKKITDVDELIVLLDCFPNLTAVDMYSSRLRASSLHALAERFPGIEFGWTLYFGDNHVLRTDATAFSTRHNSHKSQEHTSKDFEVLKYCKNLYALDLGHNRITDISFLKDMTQMRILILADNRISDLSPLENLTQIEYLELFQNKIDDISPLAGMPNLMDVNLCYNSIKDATPLMGLSKIERVWFSKNGLPEAQQEALRVAHPEAAFDFTVYSSTMNGWREHDRYFVIADVFKRFVYTDWAGVEKTPEEMNAIQ